MFSPTELAPTEDQGVIFGAIDVPANATIEQLLPYVDQVQQAFVATPEFDHSFQITFPTGGFGGMLMKPWEERKRNIFAIQEDALPQARQDHRHPGARVPALGAAQRGDISGRVRHRVDREPRGDRALRRGSSSRRR